VVRVQSAARLSDILDAETLQNAPQRDEALAQAARKITAPERDLLLNLALRHRQLPLPVRHELFTKLARQLEQRLDMRRPEFLSSERFVLNLAAVTLPPPAPNPAERDP
jgi:hypothetical protein